MNLKQTGGLMVLAISVAACTTAPLPDAARTHPAHPDAATGNVAGPPSALMGSSEVSARQESPKSVIADLYACPMHPEERSSEPGTCSICSMDLEPVEAHP